MKLIISGAAQYYDKDCVWRTLESLKPTTIVVLDSPVGPESLARNWAFQVRDYGTEVIVKYYKIEYNATPDKAMRSMLNSEMDANAIVLFGHDHQVIDLIELAQKLEYVILTVED